MLLQALGILLLAGYFRLFVNRYIDDAYITLSYASTLAHFGVWGMKPDLTSNAATSPLNVLLLAAIIKLLRNPLLSLYVFNLGTALLIYFNLRYFSLKLFASEVFGLLATALLLTNPLLTSTLGLESYLLLGLVLLACQLWDRASWPLLGLVLGALYLARPDALAVAFLFLVLLCLRRRWRQALLVLGCLLLVVLPWLSFSWYHLGSLVPDTLFLKRSQVSWNGYSFLQGPQFYWGQFRIPVLLSVLLAPGLVFLKPRLFSPKQRNSAALTLLLGLGFYAAIHFFAYSCLHVPPYHWYYVVEVAAIVIFGALGLYSVSPRLRPFTTVLLVLVVLASGVCSVRSVLVDGTPAIATNWATPGQYQQIALWTNRNVPDKQIHMAVELGTVQFYADADMVDVFADRSAIVSELATPHSALVGALLRFNFRHFHKQNLPGLRYELVPCDGKRTPLQEWATSTPYNGARQWCVYQLSTPTQE